MTDSSHVTTLRRKIRAHAPAAQVNPLTSSRAVRLALTKAANDSVGLALTVSSVAEEQHVLDDMLAALPGGMMLVALHRDGGLSGLIAVDMQLRAAALEMQTMGVLINQTAQDRTATRADKAMCDPLLAGFLAAFPEAVIGSPLAGWCDGVTHADTISDVRAAGLILEDCTYRSVQMSVDLSGTDRQGLLFMALPMVTLPQDQPASASPQHDWSATFQDQVGQSAAVLTAVLHRFDMPISVAQSLKVDQLVPLSGCTVHSVRLVSSEGRDVGQAKLGQSGGMRAVRLEEAPQMDMSELPNLGGVEGGATGMPDDLTLDMPTDVVAPKEIDIGAPLGIGDGLDGVV